MPPPRWDVAHELPYGREAVSSSKPQEGPGSVPRQPDGSPMVSEQRLGLAKLKTPHMSPLRLGSRTPLRRHAWTLIYFAVNVAEPGPVHQTTTVRGPFAFVHLRIDACGTNEK